MALVKSALLALAKLQQGELRELHGFGAKNDVFARGILRALQTHPHIVPANLDVVGAQADLEAFDALRPLLEAVRALGHDVMDFGYDGYQQLKLAGSADNSLDEMRRDIGAQFTRSRRRPAPASWRRQVELQSRLRAAFLLGGGEGVHGIGDSITWV